MEEAQVVEKTQTVKVVEGSTDHEESTSVAPEVAEVAAASGAVAVASEAVALNEKVSAEANLAAADIVRRSVGDFEQAFGELATWQGQTAERLQQTEVRQAEQSEAISSIQSSLTILLQKLQQIPPTVAAEETPRPMDPDQSVEKDEAARPRRRHRFL